MYIGDLFDLATPPERDYFVGSTVRVSNENVEEELTGGLPYVISWLSLMMMMNSNNPSTDPQHTTTPL